MGRPDYDDAVAGGNGNEAANTQADTTGCLQHGQGDGGIEFRVS